MRSTVSAFSRHKKSLTNKRVRWTTAFIGARPPPANINGDHTCQSKNLPNLDFLDKLSNSGAGDSEISNAIKDLKNKVNEKNKEQDDRLDASEAKDKKQDGRLDGHGKDMPLVIKLPLDDILVFGGLMKTRLMRTNITTMERLIQRKIR